MPRVLLTAGTFLLVLVAPVAAQSSNALRDPLEPGPHAVGFRSHWELDRTRRYTTAFDDGQTYGKVKSPRPILVNLGYPAERDESVPAMPYRDYLRIGSEDPSLVGVPSMLGGCSKRQRYWRPTTKRSPRSSVSSATGRSD